MMIDLTELERARKLREREHRIQEILLTVIIGSVFVLGTLYCWTASNLKESESSLDRCEAELELIRQF